MDRREILALIQKATITTEAGGQLNEAQSKAFIQEVMENSAFGKAIRLVRQREPKGKLHKMGNGSRLIRGHEENSDPGYRAGISTDEVKYDASELWLPFEISENFKHENIEGEPVEPKIVARMARQFALDLDDLNINGDEADAGEEKDFVALDDGLLAICKGSETVHRVDATEVGETAGAISHEHFFALKYAMPNKYVNSGRLRWFMSPNRWTSWIESLVERETGVGDAALTAKELYPLGIPPFVGMSSDDAPAMPGVPFFPDDRIILADPQNFLRVVTWDIARFKVTPNTDWELATRRKTGHVTFIKQDFVIEEEDAVADLHKLAAIEA